jgi:RNA polymerase sigma-70 factor (ECF subfamily)
MSRETDAGASPDARGFMQSDEELMSRVSEGDERAFRRLAERYAKKSFALARRMVASDADAEEIVQEMMVRMWVYAPRWRPDAALRTWIYRVVYNLCLNRRRQQLFFPLEAAGDPPDPSPSVAEELAAKQSHNLLRMAIADLPERQRAALLFTYYEGLSNAETAAVLELSVSSVESLLVRAKRTLRATLGDSLEPKS